MNTTPNHPGDKDADDKFDEVYGTKPKASQPNGTFTFQCVLRFEIDPETAANLLVESSPTQTIHAWLMTQKPSTNDNPYFGNAENLRDSLGKYLAEKKVSQARALLPCTDESKLIC